MTYNIYYSKYNILARDYISFIRRVETEDIYHEIGKMICTSLESIRDVYYTKSTANVDELEVMWEKAGYRKLDTNIWVKDKEK